MKKKNIVILVVVLVILVLAIILGINLLGGKNNNSGSNVNNEIKEPNYKPANNTEELLTKTNELKNANVSKDKIVFSNDLKVSNGEKIAIWIYSTPQFLGWFEIKEENGTKYIDGLDKALEDSKIESGKHHIAISNENEETLGYINVEINNDNEIIEKNAIKELGIPTDFYSSQTFKAQMHIKFNEDYTFNVDNEKVQLLDKNYYYISDKIDFKNGTFELVEKTNEYTKLKLVFTYNDNKTEDVYVAIYEDINSISKEKYLKMELYPCSFSKVMWFINDINNDMMYYPSCSYFKYAPCNG